MKTFAKKFAFLTACFGLVQGVAAKPLVIYFSQPEQVELKGVDAVSGASALLKNGTAYGSNQYVASYIAEKTGADLFRIETVQDYPTAHQQLLDFAQNEQRQNIKPALRALPNLTDYDTVFIGYPIWWYKMPMPLYSLFEQVDFSGKKLIPFTVHGGSRFSDSLREIPRLQPNAELIKEGLAISRDDIGDSDLEQRIDKWLSTLD